jgi:hypothetical protein
VNARRCQNCGSECDESFKSNFLLRCHDPS